MRHFDPTICCVCGRPSAGFGYRPPYEQGKPVAHTCDDLECLDIAKDTYAMRQEDFDRLDQLAAIEGGNAGGEFLEQLGKTDLADLAEEEWHGFLAAVIGGYRLALKGKLNDEAPF